jgi:hypothetical protein
MLIEKTVISNKVLELNQQSTGFCTDISSPVLAITPCRADNAELPHDNDLQCHDQSLAPQYHWELDGSG